MRHVLLVLSLDRKHKNRRTLVVGRQKFASTECTTTCTSKCVANVPSNFWGTSIPVEDDLRQFVVCKGMGLGFRFSVKVLKFNVQVCWKVCGQKFLQAAREGAAAASSRTEVAQPVFILCSSFRNLSPPPQLGGVPFYILPFISSLLYASWANSPSMIWHKRRIPLSQCHIPLSQKLKERAVVTISGVGHSLTNEIYI